LWLEKAAAMTQMARHWNKRKKNSLLVLFAAVAAVPGGMIPLLGCATEPAVEYDPALVFLPCLVPHTAAAAAAVVVVVVVVVVVAVVPEEEES
jgi:hypothetical protein